MPESLVEKRVVPLPQDERYAQVWIAVRHDAMTPQGEHLPAKMKLSLNLALIHECIDQLHIMQLDRYTCFSFIMLNFPLTVEEELERCGGEAPELTLRVRGFLTAARLKGFTVPGSASDPGQLGLTAEGDVGFLRPERFVAV